MKHTVDHNKPRRIFIEYFVLKFPQNRILKPGIPQSLYEYPQGSTCYRFLNFDSICHIFLFIVKMMTPIIHGSVRAFVLYTYKRSRKICWLMVFTINKKL